jgi:hypothetical protein
MIDYVQFVDNEHENIVESIEHYAIENFWTKDSVSETLTAELYARMISQYFDKPSTKVRKMPFSQSHPVSVTQSITVEVPEEWSIEKSSTEVSSAAFKFKREIDYFNKKVFLRYTYDSRKDHILPGESVKHVKDCDRALNELYFELTYPLNSTRTKATPSSSTNSVLLGVFLFLLVVFGIVWYHKYDPHSRD